jgi:hypothetical protein
MRVVVTDPRSHKFPPLFDESFSIGGLDSLIEIAHRIRDAQRLTGVKLDQIRALIDRDEARVLWHFVDLQARDRSCIPLAPDPHWIAQLLNIGKTNIVDNPALVIF